MASDSSLQPSETASSFLPRFYQLAVVSVLSNMMVPLAGLFDSAFLGHLADLNQLAGVILGGILFDYLYRILKFLRSSTNSLAAQAEGEEDPKGLVLALFRSGMVAVAIAVGILILHYPIQQVGFQVLSGSSDVQLSGISYFNARIWGAPAVLLNFVLIGWFLGREMMASVLLMSLVGNGLNVGLDYWLILRWGWGSVGAGMATAASQYATLLVGLVMVGRRIPWSSVPAAIQEMWDGAALRSILMLKTNILVRFLALISVYALFTNFSATLGTTLLAENGLLLQIALLSQFTIQGVGMTTQTLIGNFKGKGELDQMMPLMRVAIGSSVAIASGVALTSVCVPQFVFRVLTNHQEVSKAVVVYVPWLLPLLVLTAIAFMLEGYFIGLKEGRVLRDSALSSFVIGFLPLALCGTYFHNNHCLWAAITAYMAALALSLGIRLPKMQTELMQLTTKG